MHTRTPVNSPVSPTHEYFQVTSFTALLPFTLHSTKCSKYIHVWPTYEYFMVYVINLGRPIQITV